MFYVALAQTVDYAHPLMKRLELQSHFVRGLLLVTDLPPAALEPEVRRALAAVDPNLTITSVRTLRQQVDRSFDQQRAVASLAGLFGIVALVLAAIGLYGVTAYTVAQRTNEIGIRMALGAARGNVVGMVLQGAFRRVLVGLALGLPLAIGAGYLLSAQLYGCGSGIRWRSVSARSRWPPARSLPPLFQRVGRPRSRQFARSGPTDVSPLQSGVAIPSDSVARRRTDLPSLVLERSVPSIPGRPQKADDAAKVRLLSLSVR